MGTEKLVDRTCHQIAVQRLHVDRTVRGVMDGVHKDQGSNPMGLVYHFAQRIDGADRVGGIADRHHFGPRVELGLQVLHVEGAILRSDVNAVHLGAMLFQGLPGRNVGLVVQHGHDHFVAGLQRPADGATHVVGVGGHVQTEGDFIGGARIQEIGHGLVGFYQHPIGVLAGDEGALYVAVHGLVIVSHGIHDLPGDLSPTRTVEIDDRPAFQGSFQRRELFTDCNQVKHGGRSPGWPRPFALSGIGETF